jgi:signal peptidase I
MKMHARWLSIVLSSLALVVLAGVWLALAPLQLGGRATYVIVDGNSMEPLYHRGDLVVLRAQDAYRVGEIVTYRHPDIGPVIHRIIGRDGERYVFKGDHNDFVDPYRPAGAELIGRAWLHVAGAGAVLGQLRAPRNMAILAAVGGMIVVAPMLGTQGRRGKRRRAKPAGTPGVLGWIDGAIGGLALLALALLTLAIFAFVRPTTRSVADELTYQQTGVFSYTASAPPGLYDASAVQTGEPLFPQLTRAATFGFQYRFVADAPADLHGTYRLVAQLGAANGWKRTVVLYPETAFDGSGFDASGKLDLSELRALIDDFERQTGVQRQQYTLAIAPAVRLDGALAGQELHDTFAPRLLFRVDPQQIQLSDDGDRGQNTLAPAASGTLERTRTEPNRLALLGLSIGVRQARWLGSIGLVVALAGLGCLVAWMVRAGGCDEAARIRLKYGAQLIDVAGAPTRPDRRIVVVRRMADLARLAEKSGQMIMHEQAGDAHSYAVHDGDTTYRYRLEAGAAAEPERPAQPVMEPPPRQPHWQTTFLHELRAKGAITEACRAAGVDRPEAYAERVRVPAFAQAWQEARATRRDACAREVRAL